MDWDVLFMYALLNQAEIVKYIPADAILSIMGINIYSNYYNKFEI